MARALFPDDEQAAQAYARFTFDAEEIAAYAAIPDEVAEEQAALAAARGATQLRGELCAELRNEATASAPAFFTASAPTSGSAPTSASAAAGRSAMTVSLAARAEVLHADGPPGWA